MLKLLINSTTDKTNSRQDFENLLIFFSDSNQEKTGEVIFFRSINYYTLLKTKKKNIHQNTFF